MQREEGFRDPHGSFGSKMTDIVVSKSVLQGTIRIPPSKSQTLRAILFASLAEGNSLIRGYLHSPDAEAMIEACRHLGAVVEKSAELLHIQGVGGRIGYAEDVIHAGNSGIVFRFLTAIAALSRYPIVITGDASIRHRRPVQPLLDALNQLGVQAVSTKEDGFAPVIVRGPLRSGSALLNGEDSQPVSALLIAASQAEGAITLTVDNPGELPWIDVTLHWLDKMGVSYVCDNYRSYRIHGPCRFSGFEYSVPGDWSSASFPIAAALATGSELVLENLDMTDCQGDKRILELLQEMGARFEVDAGRKTVRVNKAGRLRGKRFDINAVIDAVAPLSVVGMFAEGKTTLTNAGIARAKECNRLQALAAELAKMGGLAAETADGIDLQGSILRGSLALQSHNDHRMAMALAVAAMGAEGESRISNTDCLAKTFPGFVDAFRALGATIREVP